MVAVISAAYPAAAMPERRPAYNKVEPTPGSLGAFLRHCREDRLRLTQDQFAELVGDGMTSTDVSQLERGKVELPKPPRMISIARAIGIPPVELYAIAGFPEFVDWIEEFSADDIAAMRQRIRRDGVDVP